MGMWVVGGCASGGAYVRAIDMVEQVSKHNGRAPYTQIYTDSADQQRSDP